MQNAEGGQVGTGPKTGKESAPNRRKEEAKQSVKKPKEKENALSQFDLNNYASKCLRLPEGVYTVLHIVTRFQQHVKCLSTLNSELD